VTAVSWVRPAAVAGTFYPAAAADLRAAVRGHLAHGRAAGAIGHEPAPGRVRTPDAIVAPHAGYRYSGATAGVGWSALGERAGAVERVVLAGPAHRVPVGSPGVGVSSAAAWHTPLCDVPIDGGAVADLVATGRAVPADDAHAPEHSLEVHLPFLVETLGPVPVVPLLIGGRCSPAAAAAALGHLWRDEGTALVVSTDLSHNLPESDARARDDRTLTAVVEGRAEDVGPEDACGRGALIGLILAARARGLVPRVLDASTSADAAGDRDRVVGYASLSYDPPSELADAERCWLVARARRAVEHRVATGDLDPLTDDDVPARLRHLGASFVTLRRDGELLGCVGSLAAGRPLWRDVARNASAAAVDDPRFPPLEPRDLDGLDVSVSVLSPPVELPPGRTALAATLRPGVDGVLVEAGGHRGTFLPSVWRTLGDADEFLAALLAKAGLPADPWPADLRAWRYTTDEFGE
jgi:AmmeMemoRadiSam system protein B/AmmeMemoRadiSam system protein A